MASTACIARARIVEEAILVFEKAFQTSYIIPS
jgi:hypothetical protein